LVSIKPSWQNNASVYYKTPPLFQLRSFKQNIIHIPPL